MDSLTKRNINSGSTREPSALEEVYAKYTIGNTELKTNIGRMKLGKEWYCNVVRLEMFEKSPRGYMTLVSKAYDIPMDTDKFVGDLFDLSLTHNIAYVEPIGAKIYVAKSKNGRTNITQEIMACLMRKLNSTTRTWSDELKEGMPIDLDFGF